MRFLINEAKKIGREAWFVIALSTTASILNFLWNDYLLSFTLLVIAFLVFANNLQMNLINELSDRCEELIKQLKEDLSQ